LESSSFYYALLIIYVLVRLVFWEIQGKTRAIIKRLYRIEKRLRRIERKLNELTNEE